VADDKDVSLRVADIAREWETVRPDIDPTSFSIMLYLLRMAVLERKLEDRVAERFGITSSDARLLNVVRSGRSSRSLRPSDLGQRLGLSRATITYRMDRLLEKGLTESESDARDGRASNISLTDKGREVVDAFMTEVNEVCLERLAAVDAIPGGREALKTLLEGLVAAWEDAEW
jgi:DNA-binding MarR family transcriptional regulator